MCARGGAAVADGLSAAGLSGGAAGVASTGTASAKTGGPSQAAGAAGVAGVAGTGGRLRPPSLAEPEGVLPIAAQPSESDAGRSRRHAAGCPMMSGWDPVRVLVRETDVALPDDFGVRVSDEASRATGLRGEDTSDWSLKKVSQ